MSHVATQWLAGLDPRLMTAGEFRVLFHLADCHTPDKGAFPSQAYLEDRAGLSHSGLNSCLRKLEEKRLIRRAKRWDDRTKKVMSTRYILGFEDWVAQEPCPKSGHGKTPEPCPLSTPSRVRSDARAVSTPADTNQDIKKNTNRAGGREPALDVPDDFDPDPDRVADARACLAWLRAGGPERLTQAPAWMVHRFRRLGLIPP